MVWKVRDGGCEYFIFIEQSVVCSIKSFTKALFLWFSFYYVFNLEYEKNSRDLCLFFQEFVFGLPDHLCKKSSTYISVSTDILCFASESNWCIFSLYKKTLINKIQNSSKCTLIITIINYSGNIHNTFILTISFLKTLSPRRAYI